MARNPFQRLEICVEDSRQGEGPANDDVAGHLGGAAWVIDGATGVGRSVIDELSDAAWYARTLDGAIRHHFVESPDASTPELLRRAVRSVAEAFRTAVTRDPEPHELPSAAFAMVRVLEHGVETSILGDCRILWRDAGGVKCSSTRDALENIELETLALLVAAYAQDPALTYEAAKFAVTPHLRANRARMNTDGGYWILSLDENAVEHLDRHVVEPADGRMLLASDGFMRLHELFGAMDLDTLLSLSTAGEVDGAMQLLRRLERQDADCRRYPRAKRMDDATVSVVRITPA